MVDAEDRELSVYEALVADPRWQARLELRLRQERNLLVRRTPLLLTCSVFLAYFALVVFRNLAFYRFVPDKNLQDLGHDLLPAMDDNVNILAVDLPMYLFLGLLAFTLFGAFVPSGKTKPFVCNAIARFLVVYAAGHLLRAATYLATSLPGAAPHCYPGSDLRPPPSIAACFTHEVSVNGNCGDLNFSGHVLLLTVGLGFMQAYGHQFWGLEYRGPLHVCLLTVGCVLAAAMIVNIIRSRHHYTVDVVVALYTGPMLWYRMQDLHLDLDVPPEQLSRQMNRELTWPAWRRCVFVLCTCLAKRALTVVRTQALVSRIERARHIVRCCSRVERQAKANAPRPARAGLWPCASC